MARPQAFCRRCGRRKPISRPCPYCGARAVWKIKNGKSKPA